MKYRPKLKMRFIPVLVMLSLWAGGSDAQDAVSKPNILLVLTDNTGWGDWGPYGGGELRGAPSPHIDRLADDGLTLLNFNTEPQCTPSRSALMTGRFAIRSGTQSVPIGTDLYGLVPWEVTIAELLSDAGYATGAFGKWHLGQTRGRWPTDQGFHTWYGIPNSTDESVWRSPAVLSQHTILKDARDGAAHRPVNVMKATRDEEPTLLEVYDLDVRRTIDGELTARTIAFMRTQAEARTPFFAFVPFTAMHYPSLPSLEFEGRSGHGQYADMLVQTDHYVGLMLDALVELGIENDTIVIFAADNGAEDPVNGGGAFTGWTGPWAGTYFTAMEGGLRAPCIIRWPGEVAPGSRSNEIVHIVDLYPTLAAAAGVQIPTDRPVDGVDMTPFFAGENGESGREGFPVFVGDELYAAKWRDWKWHFVWQKTKTSPQQKFSTVPKVINLTMDPREERNVAEPFNTWTQYPVMKVITDFLESVGRYPNVPLGAPDDYLPSPATGVQ